MKYPKKGYLIEKQKEDFYSEYTKIRIKVDGYSWISAAEALIEFDREDVLPLGCDDCYIELSVLEESCLEFEYSLIITKYFDYRKPILFLTEIWHDMELKEYNSRLKKIAKKHSGNK